MDRCIARIERAIPLAVAVLIVLGCTPVALASPAVAPTPVASSPASPSAIATSAPTPLPTPVLTPAPKITPIAGAPDSGVVLHLVAKLNRWDAATLTAPAGKTWQVEIENLDGLGNEHNFIVASGPNVESRIFSSPRFPGIETRTFAIPGIPAGTYRFFCSLHENTMTGALTLE